MLKQLVPCSNSCITSLRHFKFCAYVFKMHMHGERMEMFMCAAVHSDHIVKWSLKLPDLNKNLNALNVVCKFFSIKFHENPCTDRHTIISALLKIEIFWEVMPCGRVFPDVAKDCSAFSFGVSYLILKVKALQLL